MTPTPTRFLVLPHNIAESPVPMMYTTRETDAAETETLQEFISDSPCGPHDYEAGFWGTDGTVSHLYCPGCGSVLEIAKAKRLEGGTP